MFLKASIQAFHARDETAAAFRQMREDRRLHRAKMDIQPGGIERATSVLAKEKSADLLIVETRDTGAAFLESLGALADVCHPETKVVLLGTDNDILLYRRLLEMGIQEYLLCPVTADQLLATVDRLFGTAEGETVCRVMAFIGARGGAGSSTVAINTAFCLAQKFNEEVVLLDLDLAFGTAALALNMLPNQNVAEALLQAGRLDEVMLERFLSHHDEDFSIIAAPGRLDTTGQVDLAGFEVLMDVLSRRASFVVLDLPHQWAPWIYDILVGANEVVITATPDLASLRTTKNLFDQLGPKRGVDAPVRVVLNQVGASRRNELSTGDFEKAVSVKPSALVSHNPALFGAAMNNGELIVQAAGRSEPAQKFDRLATLLSGRTTAAAKPARFSIVRGITG